MRDFQPALLELLVCPVTKQRLSLLEERELAPLNKRILAGEITSNNDKDVTEVLSAGLITTDRKRIYRIESGIAVMLKEESLSIPT